MDNDNRKHTKVGLTGSLLLHGGLLILLWLVGIRAAEPQEESGVPVMLGTELLAKGGGKYKMTEVDVRPIAKPIPTQPKNNSSPVGEKIISQDMEKTVAIETKKESKKEEVTPNQPEETPAEKPKEKTEAELKAEAEKAAAEAAAKSMAGAFGKGNAMKDKGEADTGEGVQGSVEGTTEAGKTVGTGGYGVFDLGGRSLNGILPPPVYNVKDEGRVVVTITVNPNGQVISTEIHRRTNTTNATLRKAALDAARKARFNAVDGVDNQSGTITYYFRLK